MVLVDLTREVETEFPAYPIPPSARLPSDLADLRSLPSRSSEVDSVFDASIQESLRGPSVHSSGAPLAVYEYFPDVSENYSSAPLPQANDSKLQQGGYPKNHEEYHHPAERNNPDEHRLKQKEKKKKQKPKTMPVKVPPRRWCIVNYTLAVVIIAVFELMFAVGNLLRSGLSFVTNDEQHTLWPMEAFQIVLMLVWLFFIFLLFYAIWRSSKKLVLIHWTTTILVLVVLAICFVIYCVHGDTPGIILMAFCIPLLCYCTFVEWMYCQFLDCRPEKGVYMVVNA